MKISPCYNTDTYIVYSSIKKKMKNKTIINTSKRRMPSWVVSWIHISVLNDGYESSDFYC